MEIFDYLIVGSGLFGATFAHFAHKAGKRCLVIEKRSQLGGNVACENIAGITVHKYGAHIFHTSNKQLWDFVNNLVPFNRFTNSPLANYKGELFNLPFNMNTFRQLWGISTPAEAQKIISEQRAEAVKALACREPANLEEQALVLAGRDIFDKLIKEYTEKQWGRSCRDLPPFIIRRLPLRFSFDNNYFSDLYQGIPEGGYNLLVDALLDGTECLTNTDFFNSRYRDWRQFAHRLVYTGPLDQYFDYRLGHLEWRTVTFENDLLDIPNYQGNAVVNYTSKDEPYTRIIEHKHFESFGNAVYSNGRTVISREFSAEYAPGMEPYYPVNNDKNNDLGSSYLELAKKEENVIFGGRLASYRYYDMAPVMEAAMNYWMKK